MTRKQPDSTIFIPEALRASLADLSDLHPMEANPRRPRDRGFEQLVESIRRHGFVDPILANSHPEFKGQIIGGERRYHAATQLGMKSVPVVWLQLDAEAMADLNLRLNVPAGEWDLEALSKIGIEPLEALAFEEHILDALAELETDLASAQKPAPLKDVPLEAPALAWVLVGVPIGSFADLTALIDGAAAISGSIVETSVSDEDR